VVDSYNFFRLCLYFYWLIVFITEHKVSPPPRNVSLLIGLVHSGFGVHNDLYWLPFRGLPLKIDGNGSPGCLLGGGLEGPLLRILNVVRGVVFVVFFVEEEDGLGSGVVNACIIGSLGEGRGTSWMDCCSVMQSLRKMYFCCWLTRLYLQPFILLRAIV
jgi:hypothetical protein